MNYLKILFISLILLVLPILSSAEIQLQSVILNQGMIVFNYTDWETQGGLLMVTLQNTENQEEIFDLKVLIQKGGVGGETVYESNSYKYVFGPNEVRTIDNTELLSFSKSISYDEATQTGFLELGYIGAGTYCFFFQIDNNPTISDPSWCFTIANPSTPELIFPGSPDYLDPIEIMNETPLFQWTSISGAPGVYYEFTLCEIQLNEEGVPEQTPEEGILNQPMLFANSDQNPELFLPPNNTSLLYPAMEPMEGGKLYCWQIIGYAPSSDITGYDPFVSEVWTFKFIEDPTLTPEQIFLIDFLTSNGVSEEIINWVREGKLQNVKLDGENIPINELISNLSGQINLISTELEDE